MLEQGVKKCFPRMKNKCSIIKQKHEMGLQGVTSR